jgi:hypothetical protein
MIDSACADDVVAAFVDAVRRDVRLPKIVRLPSFEIDAVVYPAMLRHLAGTGQHREFFRVERPSRIDLPGSRSLARPARNCAKAGTDSPRRALWR